MDFVKIAEKVVSNLENGNITDAVDLILGRKSKAASVCVALEVVRIAPSWASSLLRHVGNRA